MDHFSRASSATTWNARKHAEFHVGTLEYVFDALINSKHAGIVAKRSRSRPLAERREWVRFQPASPLPIARLAQWDPGVAMKSYRDWHHSGTAAE